MKKNKELLTIQNLKVSVEGKEILHGISLTIQPGTVHAVMGPNGSGKSTLAYAVMGHPGYEWNSNVSIKIGKNEISQLEPEERAKNGLFLAFQSPIAVPGVSVINLMRTAYQEIHKDPSIVQKKTQNPVLDRRWNASDISLSEFMQKIKDYAKALHMDDTFLTRGIHDGFSGGEKKKLEMLQALILAPKYAIFDEIDTGLDVDALKVVASGIEMLTKQGTGVIIITHYQRLLSYVTPDQVHVLVKGHVVKQGDEKLAREIEEKGYKQYVS